MTIYSHFSANFATFFAVNTPLLLIEKNINFRENDQVILAIKLATVLKGTFMQIEKTRINDRLRVSKIS